MILSSLSSNYWILNLLFCLGAEYVTINISQLGKVNDTFQDWRVLSDIVKLSQRWKHQLLIGRYREN